MVDAPRDPRPCPSRFQLIDSIPRRSDRGISAGPNRRIRRGITSRRDHRRRARSVSLRHQALGQHIDSVCSFPSPCTPFPLRRCCVTSIHEIQGLPAPHGQGHPSVTRGAFHVKRTTQRARLFSVIFHDPCYSLHARPTPPHPGYPVAQIGVRDDFAELDLYIDITFYL